MRILSNNSDVKNLVAFSGKGTNSNKCILGFEYGSIDYANLDVAINMYQCPNITSQVTLQQCIANTSAVTSMVPPYYAPQGGFYVNSSGFTVDLGSQLVYYQFVTSQPGVIVTTWDGQSQFFAEVRVFSLYAN